MTLTTVRSPVQPPLAALNLDIAPAPRRAYAVPLPVGLDQPSSPLTQALDCLDDGLVLTTPLSGVVYANRAARAIFACGPLSVKNGTLCAGNSGETQELHRLVAGRGSASQRAAFLRLSVPGGRRHLLLTVTTPDGPAANALAEQSTVLVVIRDGRRATPPSPQMVSTFFGLTPAEARLACEMIKGDGLKACANRLGITPNTARTHLNRVFDKTGTKRQAELVRHLLSCRCSIGSDGPDRAA